MFLNEYLRIGGAARYLGVSVFTLRNWCRNKKIPFYIGVNNKQRYFKGDDLVKIKERMKLEYGVKGCKRFYRKIKKRRKKDASDANRCDSQPSEGIVGSGSGGILEACRQD